MENKNEGIYFVLSIIKADNSPDRTVVKLTEQKNGKNEYEDLRTLKTISALAKGNRALVVSRCVGTEPKDRIVSCDPFKPALFNNISGELLNFEEMDDSTRTQTVGVLLNQFDEEAKQRKTH